MCTWLPNCTNDWCLEEMLFYCNQQNTFNRDNYTPTVYIMVHYHIKLFLHIDT